MVDMGQREFQLFTTHAYNTSHASAREYDPDSGSLLGIEPPETFVSAKNVEG